MNDRLFSKVWADAQEQSDKDVFVSDWSTSSEFLDPEKPEEGIDSALSGHLSMLWDVANLPFGDFLDLLHLSQTDCSVRYCIPLRTVQSWALWERNCPSYIRLMMAELYGITGVRDYCH